MGSRDPPQGLPTELTRGLYPLPTPPAFSNAQKAKRDFGARLGEIRKTAGLTGRALASSCGWHESKVSRIENGKTAPSAEDIRLWAAHCDVPDQTADLIASLEAIEGMFVQWRRMEPTRLRRAHESVLPLWQRTRRFRTYSPWLIPGAVQTESYTRALLAVPQPAVDSPMTSRVPSSAERAPEAAPPKGSNLRRLSSRAASETSWATQVSWPANLDTSSSSPMATNYRSSSASCPSAPTAQRCPQSKTSGSSTTAQLNVELISKLPHHHAARRSSDVRRRLRPPGRDRCSRSPRTTPHRDRPRGPRIAMQVHASS